jgi:hypothetical protein
MRDFEESTLWRVSEFERIRQETGSSGYMMLDGQATALSSTLMSELRMLERRHAQGDVLEVVAACVRHREPGLLYLCHQEVVWPVTLFPTQMLYHSPRDMAEATPEGLAGMKLLSLEPPGVRAPGHWMFEPGGRDACYRPLVPMLWMLALKGPRADLLNELSGPAAYRLMHSRLPEGVSAPGALGSAVERLRRESVSLKTIAGWPGMSAERASRLLNALYLASELMITRSHPAARDTSSGGLFGWRRSR